MELVLESMGESASMSGRTRSKAYPSIISDALEDRLSLLVGGKLVVARGAMAGKAAQFHFHLDGKCDAHSSTHSGERRSCWPLEGLRPRLMTMTTSYLHGNERKILYILTVILNVKIPSLQ